MFIKNVVFNFFRAIAITIKRFPVATLITGIGTALAWFLIGRYSVDYPRLTKTLIVAVVAFPWEVCATLILERAFEKWHYRLAGQAGVFIIAILFYFALSSPLTAADNARAFIMTLVGFVTAFFASFDRTNVLEHWQFVGTSISRFITAALFTIGLGLGVSAGVLAVNYLFFDTSYLNVWLLIRQLWIIAIGIFGSWFWLAGLPQAKGKSEYELPIIVSLFLRYIWIPLVIAFFVILYAYLVKVLLLWQWPKGGVAQWILAFAGVGMVAFLVAYTLSRDAAHGWLQKIFVGFFVSLLPLVIVLFVAIGVRMNAYGVTEPRYLVTMGGVWLLANALYYLFSKSKTLRFAPYSLSLVLLLAIAGPWNMFTVSMNSQVSSLQKLLVQNHIMQNGQIVRAASPIVLSSSEYDTIQSKFEYIIGHDGAAKIKPWLPGLAISNADLTPYGSSNIVILNAANVQYNEPAPLAGDALSDYSFAPEMEPAFDTSGYDFIIMNVIASSNPRTAGIGATLPSGSFTTVLSGATIVEIKKDGIVIGSLDLKPTIEQLRAHYGTGIRFINRSDATVTFENDQYRFKLIINDLRVPSSTTDYSIDNFTFTLLGGKK